MRVLGLTGLIAAGKTEVARVLGSWGAQVIDCDQLSRAATASGTPGAARIVEHFGPRVADEAGGLDRQRLAALVFADSAALAELEAIVHPMVAAARDGLLAGTTVRYAVVEAIKLFEAGFAAQCDEVWVVTAPIEVRYARLLSARALSSAAALARLNAQRPEAELTALADRVIANHGDRSALLCEIATAWRSFIAVDALQASVT